MNGWMVHSLALYAILTSSPLSATTTDPTTTNKTAMTTRNSNENVGKTSTTQSKKEKKNKPKHEINELLKFQFVGCRTLLIT